MLSHKTEHPLTEQVSVAERLRSAGGDERSTTSKRPTSPLGCIVWFAALQRGASTTLINRHPTRYWRSIE